MDPVTGDNLQSSVVLCSWSADVDRIGASPHNVVQELIVLSLLYDRVWIPDEALALADQFASWFGPSDSSDVFPQLLDVGALGVLTHPQFAYGETDDDLRSLALRAPLAARAKYIQRRSTRNANPFSPGPLQECLYDKLDLYFQAHPECMKPARSPNEDDPSKRMSLVLNEVLSNRRYDAWCASAFPAISLAMKRDFVRFIADPEEVARWGERNNHVITLLRNAQGGVFNRSLGFQAAEMYPPEQATAMQELISTCYAAPFCLGHSAAGRYGGRLRELLVLPPENEIDLAPDEPVVAVDAVVDTHLHLPILGGQFAGGLRSIRESEEGIRLRRAMGRLGEESDFKEQVECWSAVADRLAGVFAPAEPLVLRNALLTVGGRAIRGAVFGTLAAAALGAQPNAFAPGLPRALIAAGMGVAADHLMHVARVAYRKQEIRSWLEQAVSFRCSTVPLVEFGAGSAARSSQRKAIKPPLTDTNPSAAEK